MLDELLKSLQYGDTPLHLALREGHTTCVEYLLSTPGIDVNIKRSVSDLSKINNGRFSVSSYVGGFHQVLNQAQ